MAPVCLSKGRWTPVGLHRRCDGLRVHALHLPTHLVSNQHAFDVLHVCLDAAGASSCAACLPGTYSASTGRASLVVSQSVEEAAPFDDGSGGTT